MTTVGKVNTGKLGEYELSYHTKFLFWEKKWTRTVVVQDSKAPKITLKSTEGYYVLPGGQYEEEGFSAYDECDGDLTEKVTRTEADGIVTYVVADKSGNQTKVERKINYNDPIPPEITLAGEKTITITAGEKFEEPGYTAVDNCDGDLTQNVKVEGSVDTRKAGTYKLVYTVQDTYENTVTVERTVIVKAVQVQIPKPETPGNAGNPVNPVKPNGKVIYLTFDDGPGPYTKDLLAVLDKYQVKATFFVVNGKYNYMIAEEAKAGHSIGIHSTTHDYAKIYSSKQAYFDDLFNMQNIIYNLTGIKPTLMRFPGGSSNKVSIPYCPGIMTDLTKSVIDSGFQYFDWSVTSGDAGATTDTSVVLSNVINGIKGKNAAVVLQHDSKKYSIDAVEEIILWGLNNGYSFGTLDMSGPIVHHNVQN